MPWNAPKSLSSDEDYAVTAFILNLGGIVPDDFTLSDANIRSVQERLPNRRGMTTDHAMWPGKAFGQRKPDTTAIACMSGCATESKVASFLPDYARNQHGNLAEQNRLVGPQRGADTTRPPASSLSESAARPVAPVAVALAPSSRSSASGFALAQKQGCTACHGIDTKLVGPSFVDISKKHAARGDALAYLADKIRAGGAGVWGAIPMPPQALAETDAQALARWLIDGAKKQ
jgi:cytochrome c